MQVAPAIFRLIIRCGARFEAHIVAGPALPDYAGGLRDSGLGSWTGFYDWLRRSEDSIVGLRYWPFEQAAALLQATQTPGAAKTPDGALLFQFDADPNYDETISADQAFEESRLLVDSETDELTFVFGCSDLTRGERASLTEMLSKTSRL
jgi:hypothetical protein